MDKETRFGRGRALVASVSVILLALTAVACGGNDDEEGTAGGGDGGQTIEVGLQEWAVAPSSTSASAGEVTFEITNEGEETHEFVVLRTDLSALDLPTADDGSVNEGGEVEVVDEVEDIPSGEREELSVDLDAGHYVLICNVVEEEDGETESHYQMGMRTDFEVE